MTKLTRNTNGQNPGKRPCRSGRTGSTRGCWRLASRRGRAWRRRRRSRRPPPPTPTSCAPSRTRPWCYRRRRCACGLESPANSATLSSPEAHCQDGQLVSVAGGICIAPSLGCCHSCRLPVRMLNRQTCHLGSRRTSLQTLPRRCLRFLHSGHWRESVSSQPPASLVGLNQFESGAACTTGLLHTIKRTLPTAPAALCPTLLDAASLHHQSSLEVWMNP